jgi:hypothetical protein
MQCPLRLVDDLSQSAPDFLTLMPTYHLVTTPNKDRDCPRVGTLLNDQHLLLCRSKRDFPDQTSVTELVGCEILESGDNPAIGRNGDELIVRTCNTQSGRRQLTSISGPPTHRTAGSSFCINKWFASSSKPHWQITKLAPVSLTLWRISIAWSKREVATA